jgi:uncharacterized protein YgbK (DUF1537 family)
VSIVHPVRRTTSVCVLADDLTGACDAAAAFASRGARTLVSLNALREDDSLDVQALCTATRDADPIHAAATLNFLVQSLPHGRFTEIFKKVDSVFRGNTFVEIAATIRAFPDRLAIIAPSFPAAGRTSADGMLHIQDLTGHQSIPLREGLRATGVHPAWLAATHDLRSLAASMQQPAQAIFCEASDDQHLQTIVQAARGLKLPILWIGSAGLAHALSAALYSRSASPAPRLPRGGLLLFTGSNHPVSLQQLASLLTESVTVVHIERNVTSQSQIREAASHIEHGTLLMNGGDTALQVCRALGILALQILGEFAPGIPQATACGGRFDGATVILKSGGFGDADLLCRIAALCTRSKDSL